MIAGRKADWAGDGGGSFTQSRIVLDMGDRAGMKSIKIEGRWTRRTPSALF